MNEFIAEREQPRSSFDENQKLKCRSLLQVDALSLLQSSSSASDKVSEQSANSKTSFSLKPLVTAGSFAAVSGAIEGTSSIANAKNAKFALENPKTHPELYREGSMANRLLKTTQTIDALEILRESNIKSLNVAKSNLSTANTEAAAVLKLHTEADAARNMFLSPEQVTKRREFLTGQGLATLAYDGNKADSYIGTYQDVRDNAKLFHEGSREANLIHTIENIRVKTMKVEANLRELQSSLEIHNTELSALKTKISNTSTNTAFLKGFKSGTAISGACLLAGHCADKAMGIESSANSFLRSSLDGLVVPTALLSNLSKPLKVTIVAASFGLSRTLGVIEYRKNASR